MPTPYDSQVRVVTSGTGSSYRLSALLLPLAVFLVAFAALPLRVMGGLAHFPGDEGDARLNAYFLENVYRFLVGDSPSLWTLGIFSPFPYTLGFSDNLFGAAPVYVVARILTQDSFVAFMSWWYLAWVANFVASYWASRTIGLQRLGATVAALVYTFGLPITSTFSWPQFAYRFAAPLAVACLWSFLERRGWWQLVAAGGWTVWQFYCSIYMGVFTLVVLAAVALGYGVTTVVREGRSGVGIQLREHLRLARELGVARGVLAVASVTGLGAAMAILLWPYLKVTQLYGATRSYAEIQSMEPTFRTYLMNEYSIIWKSFAASIDLTAMRLEHQFFPGLVLALLCVLGVVFGIQGRAGTTRRLRIEPAAATMATALAAMVLVTYSFRGHSLWFFVAQLPLFSAIRAVARVALVMLIPAGFLAGRAVDLLWAGRSTAGKGIAVAAVALLTVEFAAVTPIASSVQAWRTSEQAAARLPSSLPADAITFTAQTGDHWWWSEVTAMWAAIDRRVPTLNGYSGGMPPGFADQFGGDCSELPRRVQSYLRFSGQPGDEGAYRALMARMVPVGFSGCQQSWWQAPPVSTATGSGVTSAQVAALQLGAGVRTPSVRPDELAVDVAVTNNGTTTVSAGGTNQVRLSLRYLNPDGTKVNDFAGGLPLRYDLAPGDTGAVSLPLDRRLMVPGGSVEVARTLGDAVPGMVAPSVSIAIR